MEHDQMLLQLAELEKLQAGSEAPKPPKQVIYEREARETPRPKRDPAEAFAKLPVQESIVIEPEEVKAEPEAFEKIGEERTFEVDIIPPKLYKREFVRPKYRRKDEPTLPPVLAPAPARPVVGGYASAGLIAWIITNKYLDHQPLYRQEQMFQRQGVTIPRQTMVELIRLAAEVLQPVYKFLHKKILELNYIQVDDGARSAEMAQPGA